MRARIAIVAVVVVTAAALGGVKWASAAAPLSADVTSTAPIGLGKPLAGPIPSFHYRRGAAYYSELSIENSSRVPVTLTGVDETGAATMRVILRLNGTHEPGVYAKTTPFHPVSIAAGGSQLVEVFWVISNNCRLLAGNGAGEGQASTTVVSIPLTFTMLKGVVKNSQWVDIDAIGLDTDASDDRGLFGIVLPEFGTCGTAATAPLPRTPGGLTRP